MGCICNQIKLAMATIIESTVTQRKRAKGNHLLKRSGLRLPKRHQRHDNQHASQISITTINNSHLNM